MHEWMPPLSARLRIAGEQFGKKTVETMQNRSAIEPLRVTQEAVEAYEKRTGFFGIGKKMVEHGRWKIVAKEETPCRHN